MPMYYALGNHIYSLTSMISYVFLVWQSYFFSIHVILNHSAFNVTLETVHVYKPIRCYVDSLKYFIFVMYICPYTSMIPEVLFVKQSSLFSFCKF